MNLGYRAEAVTPQTMVAALVSALAWSSLAIGQVPGGSGGGSLPTANNQELEAARQAQQSQLQDGFTPQWAPPVGSNKFNGFPLSFPKGLGAFGSYPVASGSPGVAGLLSTGPGGLPVFALPIDEPPGWPRWLRAIDAPEFPYVPEQALLLRHAERVWWKSPSEEVFVPLYFHDKVRSVVGGTEVEVRQTGEFELLLHGGGRIASQGRAHLRMETMDDKQVVLKVSEVSKLRVQVSGREFVLHLPDNSTLTVPADLPPATPEDLPMGPAALVIDRADEPGEFRGRASIWNAGQRPVHWRHALGETSLLPGQRVQFFLLQMAGPGGPGLTALQANVVAEETRRLCTASADGAIDLCGAHFDLRSGMRLVIDPLQGNPFEASSSPLH